MAEVNWAVEVNGAHVADASFEAANGLNSAANLLRSREDELWLAGVAPQHVTVALARSHPPLHYAGWHVWLDSPTNPKVVEIASGPALAQLRPVLVCEALPGAGTQVWHLPRAIPTEHLFVRFRLLESFGPGPTYLNTLVLLEGNPGPDHGTNDSDAPPTTSVSLAEKDPQLGNSAVSTPYMRRSPAADVGRITGGSAAGERTSPPPQERTPPSSGPRPQPAGINVSASSRGGGRYADDGARSDVGVFVDTRSGMGDGPLQANSPTARGRSSHTRSPRERSGSSRMSQLLRDLDDDIKLLKPIKSLTPAKNMLMYLPQEQPEAPTRSLDGSDDDAEGERSTDRKGRHVHVADRRRGSEDTTRSSGSSKGGGGGGGPRQHRSNADVYGGAGNARVSPRLPPVMHPSPMEYALYTSTDAASGQHSAAQEARINALERAVAALNEAVQHQRDDLTMIKRLLLQQSAERRKEAEYRYEEKQRYEKIHGAGSNGGVMVVPSTSAAAPPAPPPPPPPPSSFSAVSPGLLPDARLTHRSITVDFPEDALRVFVESVLDKRMRKHTKKVEAKLLERLDKQLHDVMHLLSATVDGQAMVRGTNPSASFAGPSMSTSRSMHPEHVHALNHSGQVYSPMSESSVAQDTPHIDRSGAGGSAQFPSQRGGGVASFAVHTPDALHTPRSQSETSPSAFRYTVSGGGSGNRVRGTL